MSSNQKNTAHYPTRQLHHPPYCLTKEIPFYCNTVAVLQFADGTEHESVFKLAAGPSVQILTFVAVGSVLLIISERISKCHLRKKCPLNSGSSVRWWANTFPEWLLPRTSFINCIVDCFSFALLSGSASNNFCFLGASWLDSITSMSMVSIVLSKL